MQRVAIAATLLLTACASTSAEPDTSPAATPDTTVAATTHPTTSTSSTTSSTTTSSTTSTTSTTTTVVVDTEPSPAELAVAQQFLFGAAALMERRAHGIGVAIARDGVVITDFTLGNDTSGRPLTTDAGFRLASISKVLTTVVVLQLAEEDVLDLDDTLGELWGAPWNATDVRVSQITVRELLQHTSGFGPLRDTFFKNGVSDWHDAAAVALGSRLDHDPGTFYRYSNANFVVLGALVERLTGASLEEEVTRRVLDPVGVTTGVLGRTTALSDPTGPAYLVDPNRRYMEALGPAGAWTMSPGDIARVLGALQPSSTAPLLSDASIQLMRTPTLLPDDEPNWSYGLGTMVFPAFVGHTGTIEDVRTFVIDLPNGYTVSVLAATSKVASGEDLIDEFLPELIALAALPPTG